MPDDRARRGFEDPLFGPEPPDVYADNVGIKAGLYGFNFDFGVGDMSNDGAKRVAVVRMSPQHAFVLCQILRKHLKAYEAEVGPISLPDKLFKDLGIEREL